MRMSAERGAVRCARNPQERDMALWDRARPRRRRSPGRRSANGPDPQSRPNIARPSASAARRGHGPLPDGTCRSTPACGPARRCALRPTTCRSFASASPSSTRAWLFPFQPRRQGARPRRLHPSPRPPDLVQRGGGSGGGADGDEPGRPAAAQAAAASGRAAPPLVRLRLAAARRADHRPPKGDRNDARTRRSRRRSAAGRSSLAKASWRLSASPSRSIRPRSCPMPRARRGAGRDGPRLGPAVEAELVAAAGAPRATRLALTYMSRFPDGYRARTGPEEAAADILRLSELATDDEARGVRLSRSSAMAGP
jgi:hypothetical protein